MSSLSSRFDLQTVKFACASLVIGAAVVTTVVHQPAQAGDFSHTCTTADGFYTINDDVLKADRLEADGTPGMNLDFEVIKDMPLAHRKGYCLSKTGAAKGRFTFEFRRYLRTFKLTGNSADVELTALCEFAASGLPAAANCDEEVVTLDWQARIANPKPTDTQ